MSDSLKCLQPDPCSAPLRWECIFWGPTAQHFFLVSLSICHFSLLRFLFWYLTHFESNLSSLQVLFADWIGAVHKFVFGFGNIFSKSVSNSDFYRAIKSLTLRFFFNFKRFFLTLKVLFMCMCVSVYGRSAHRDQQGVMSCLLKGTVEIYVCL